MRKLALLTAVAALAACGPTVKTVSVDPDNASLTSKAQTATLKATPKDEKGQPVTDAAAQLKWSSSDAKVATVDGAGKVTAVSSGSATITAAVGEVKGTAKVTVSIPATVALAPKDLSLMAGKSASLVAQVKDDAGNPVSGAAVTWTTSDPKVATVANGQVAAAGTGTATITAALGDLKGTAAVTVKMPEFQKVAVTPAKHTLKKVGETVQLKAEAMEKKGAVSGVPFTWSSSNEKVATVSPAGLVTAVKKGSAKITAKAGDKKAEAAITVK